MKSESGAARLALSLRHAEQGGFIQGHIIEPYCAATPTPFTWNTSAAAVVSDTVPHRRTHSSRRRPTSTPTPAPLPTPTSPPNSSLNRRSSSWLNPSQREPQSLETGTDELYASLHLASVVKPKTAIRTNHCPGVKRPRPCTIHIQTLQPREVESVTVTVQAHEETPEEFCTSLRRLKSLEQTTHVSVAKAKCRTMETMHKVAEMVPVQMLISHGMFEFAQQKALLKVLRLLHRLRKRVVKVAIRRWHGNALRCTLELKTRNVIILQSVYRAFRAKKTLQGLKRRKEAFLRQQQRLSMIRSKNMKYLAVMVQSCYRGRVVRKWFAEQINQVQCARRIQRFWREVLDKERKWKCIHVYVRQIRAARSIQRVFRGYLGRSCVKRMRKAIRKAEVLKRLDARGGVYMVYFEQSGAAIKLQRWWTSLPCHVEATRRFRNKKFGLYRDAKARKIQRVWRGYLARKTVQAMRQALEIEQVMTEERPSLLRGIIASTELFKSAAGNVSTTISSIGGAFHSTWKRSAKHSPNPHGFTHCMKWSLKPSNAKWLTVHNFSKRK